MATLDDAVAQIGPMKDALDGFGAALDQILAQDSDIKARLDATIASGADPVKLQAISDALGNQTTELQNKRQVVLDTVAKNTVLG